MASKDYSKFIKALDTLKQDYTCNICGELCKDPVTLASCFHLICSEHFEGLEACPTCSKPLINRTTFKDNRLRECIESAKQLDKMFQPFRDTSNVKQTSKADSDSVKKRTKIESTEVKENVPTKANRIKKGSKTEKLDVTVGSNVSSTVNKAIEKRNNKGETALHIACRLGKVETVTELLNQGANTNTKDNAGWTPLHEVVQNGRLDLVKLLLQFNTLVNVPGLNNETPLHEAVRFKHNDIIKELVKNGADIHARNCKGETPIELASLDIKKVLESAVDEIVQTQGFNVTLISEIHTELDCDEIRVYCASSFRTVHNKLKLLSKHHNNLHVEAGQKFSKKVTHLVVDTEDDKLCSSSLDVLQAIVLRNWIISSEWIVKSTKDKLEPFYNFEVIGVGPNACNGPKNARYAKYKQLPGLFNGCHFYLHNFNTDYVISKSVILNKTNLSKLITDAGGTVLRRVPNPELIPEAEKLVPYHAKKGGKLSICSHYIIFKDNYQPMYNMKHLKALPVGWLIDCIERYELCEP